MNGVTEMNKHTLLVTAAIIEHGGRILIAQRKQNAHQGLKWEFPGGKVERDEDPRDTLRREIKEELDIDIEVGEVVETVFHRYPEYAVLLLFYRCTYLGGRPAAKDCRSFRWVTKEELPHYEFAAADLPVVKKLIN